MNEMKFYENKDISEIINMQIERTIIYSKYNKIKANKIFEKYYSEYLDRRIVIGTKRMRYIPIAVSKQ